MTEEETEALRRLVSSPDGRVLIQRLERARTMRQEIDLEVSGSESDRNKGRILEIRDILQEFADATRVRPPPRSGNAAFG